MIKKRLNKPFPALELDIKNTFYLSLFFGIFVIFLLFLISLNVSDNDYNFLINIPIFGLITFMSVFIVCFFSPKVFKKFFDSQSWTVFKQIIFSFVNIFIITIINAIFVYYNNFTELSFFYIFLMNLLQTFLIGIIPTIILTFWVEQKYYKKHYKIAKEQSNKITNKNKLPDKNTVFDFSIGKEIFKIESQNLLYIKADGNYCTIFYNKENSINKKMLRSSLKNIEDKVKDNEKIIRCHKSYIVNMNKVINMTGNARGYNFFLNETDFAIPVSRNFPKSLLKKLN